MTLMEKIKEMDLIPNEIYKECERLIASNAIEDTENDGFVNAKIVLGIALLNLSNNLRPYSVEYKQTWDNLKKF